MYPAQFYLDLQTVGAAGLVQLAKNHGSIFDQESDSF